MWLYMLLLGCVFLQHRVVLLPDFGELCAFFFVRPDLEQVASSKAWTQVCNADTPGTDAGCLGVLGWKCLSDDTVLRCLVHAGCCSHRGQGC